jgi:hypothetical protein
MSAAWRILEDGVLAGLVGAVAVALWFLLVDSIRVTPFYTPNLLGSVIFTGTSAANVPPVTLTMVFAYTGLHILVFLVAGLMAAWIFAVFEDNPQFGMVLLLLVLLFLAVLCGLEIAMMPSMVGLIGTGSVAVANLLAAAGMFAFLLRRRPHALARLRAGYSE